jgi:hypothetical protein
VSRHDSGSRSSCLGLTITTPEVQLKASKLYLQRVQSFIFFGIQFYSKGFFGSAVTFENDSS